MLERFNALQLGDGVELDVDLAPSATCIIPSLCSNGGSATPATVPVVPDHHVLPGVPPSTGLWPTSATRFAETGATGRHFDDIRAQVCCEEGV